MKNEKKFIQEEKELRLENDSRLLADLIYLNYKYSNGKPININHVYNTLHDIINYTEEEVEKILEHAFIYLMVDYKLELQIY